MVNSLNDPEEDRQSCPLNRDLCESLDQLVFSRYSI